MGSNKVSITSHCIRCSKAVGRIWNVEAGPRSDIRYHITYVKTMGESTSPGPLSICATASENDISNREVRLKQTEEGVKDEGGCQEL